MNEPTLTGQKIVLRPYREADAEALFGATQNPTLRRLTGTHRTFTLEQTRRYTASFADADDRAGFVIAEPKTLAPLGEVVLLDIDPDNRSCGLRISMFREEDLSKGYGTEALRLALDYGFGQLKLHRISLDVFGFNDRAIHVYEKIGFRREGVLRHTLFYDGQFHDTIIMSILEEEWPRVTPARAASC